MVWKLDRLGRSLRNLIDVVKELEARGVGFRSLHESLDTTTPGGRLIFHIFGAPRRESDQFLRPPVGVQDGTSRR